ncbi:MAG: hypothetical protein JST26_07100 [Bacteroidetes bacterium]|nr:hypothetical protein [Bacteroidota bacterium]
MKTHNLQLLKGSFTKEEAISLLTRLVDVKIKYHEDKIHQTSSEEDIKMRENRIKQLQKELYEARLHIEKQQGRIELNSEIIL